MGNSVSALAAHLFNAQPPDTWTSPPGDEAVMNRSPSSQLSNMLFFMGVPIFCVVALASKKIKYGDRLVEEDKQYPTMTSILRLKQELERLEQQQRQEYRELPYVKYAPQCSDTIKNIEEEEEILLKEKLAKVAVYDEGLKDILHIRCSLFQSKKERAKLEEDMIGHFASDDREIHKTVALSEIRDVMRNDHAFCGNNREENGKFRQMYVQNWKTKLELEKYQRILRRVKEATSTESNSNS